MNNSVDDISQANPLQRFRTFRRIIEVLHPKIVPLILSNSLLSLKIQKKAWTRFQSKGDQHIITSQLCSGCSFSSEWRVSQSKYSFLSSITLLKFHLPCRVPIIFLKSLSPPMLLHKSRINVDQLQSGSRYRELVSGFSEIACVLAAVEKIKLRTGSPDRIRITSSKFKTMESPDDPSSYFQVDFACLLSSQEL